MDKRPGEEGPYERPLGAAIAGNGTRFTREDAVEAVWAVVLDNHHRAYPNRHQSWGPTEVGALIAADDSWHNPMLEQAE